MAKAKKAAKTPYRSSVISQLRDEVEAAYAEHGKFGKDLLGQKFGVDDPAKLPAGDLIAALGALETATAADTEEVEDTKETADAEGEPEPPAADGDTQQGE